VTKLGRLVKAGKIASIEVRPAAPPPPPRRRARGAPSFARAEKRRD
jgi:hypothetical protein